MAFIRPTLTEIRQAIEADIDARLPGADSRLRRSVLSALARAMAGAVHLVHGFQSRLAGQLFADTATGGYLERHAAVHDVARKPAAFAAGSVDLTGSDGAVLPAGSVLQRSDGTEFDTDAEATIVAGVAVAAITTAAAGADGNMAAGQTLTVVSPPAGIDAAAAVAVGGITGGAAAEVDDDLRARLLAKLREPAHGGAESDYERWALEVAGITRAWVFPLENGAGTVTVRVVDDDGAGSIVPNAAKISEVQDYIDARRPVTADVAVAAPAEAAMDFTITLVPNTATVQAAVTAALDDLLRREGAPGGTILISHIREAISTAAGETNHILTAPAADVAHAVTDIPVPGVITWA